MRFIGGKNLLLDDINTVITDNIDEPIHTVGDLFCGSAVVSQFFKRKGYRVISNDMMYMSYVLARGSIELNEMPKFSRLDIKDVFSFLNSIAEPLDYESAFIYRNYSPNKNCARMYFQEKNAMRIDGIRQQLQLWLADSKITSSEYFYLLACLLSAVPYVANITGVYAAYLKHWDKRTYNDLALLPLPLIESAAGCECFNLNALELCRHQAFDMVYIDTPYNQRQYLPNYHVLETIAKYDTPNIHGITGMRDYERSDFCIKANVEQAFVDLLSSLNSSYAIISYNSEALLSTEKMISILEGFGRVRLYEVPYRRYASKKSQGGNKLKEQIYFVDLR